MTTPKVDQVQEALRKLLISPKVNKQVRSALKTRIPLQIPPTVSEAAKTGDIQYLCEYLRKNPTSQIPTPIYHLIERLRYLYRKIDSDAGRNPHAPSPTNESLQVDEDGRPFLPVGTRKAAHQAQVDLFQAWVQGFLPRYTLEPPKLGRSRRKKKGPKDKYDSELIYGHPEGRLELFSAMENYLEEQANLKIAKGETTQDFENRARELVKALHIQFGWEAPTHRYIKGGRLGSPVPSLLDLPSEHVETIVRKAMRKAKKSISSSNIIYGLLALYERDNPSQYKAIRQLITRKI